MKISFHRLRGWLGNLLTPIGWKGKMAIGLALFGLAGLMGLFATLIVQDAWDERKRSRATAVPERGEPMQVQRGAPEGTPEEEARRNLVTQRNELERAALPTKGTPLTYEFDNSGIGQITLTRGDKGYPLQITKCSATAIWVYPNHNAVKWASVVKTVEPGQLIDVRTLRRIRDSTPVEIGQRAFFEMEDGTILQLVVVGVLYYNAGDDKDEVRIKYRMYDAGEFLIQPL
jgi:hypothetical protein